MLRPLSLGLITAGIGWLILACTSTAPSREATLEEPLQAVIVQGEDLDVLRAVVTAAGGTVTHDLAIIDAVGARLTPAQRADLERHDAVACIYDDRFVGVVDDDSDSDSDSDSGGGGTGSNDRGTATPGTGTIRDDFDARTAASTSHSTFLRPPSFASSAARTSTRKCTSTRSRFEV